VLLILVAFAVISLIMPWLVRTLGSRAFYIAGSKNGAALGLTGVGDNDAFVMKIAPKPLDKEDVKLGPAPGQGGARGGARGGRAGRAGN